MLSYIIIYTRRVHRNKLDTAKMIFDHQKNILHARLEEQERAMAQISKEVHDNVSQKIDFIQMNVKALDESRPDDDNSKFVSNIRTISEQVANDLRNISYSLNSDYIKKIGLGEVMAKELSYIESSKHIPCRLHIEGVYKSLSAEKELLIFRIAQEALHNAVKYAQASAISIELRYEEQCLSLEIADNGIGFDRTRQANITGLGIRNMQQRADLLNSKLQIDTAPRRGCAIRLAVAI